VRIVHVYKDYHPPVRGGIEQTIERMARWQVAAGHDVTVIASASGARRSRTDNVDGVRVVRVGEWARALSSPICPGFPAALARARADLWHLHSPNPLGEASFRLVRPAGAVVFTYYCDLSRQRAFLPVYAPLVRALLRRADVRHAISPQALERPDSIVAPFRDSFRVVPLGIDAAPFLALDRDRPGARALRERFGDPFLLFVGRLRHYKGLHVLLDAMPRVSARLVVVGDGPKGPALREQTRRLGLGRRVHFAGSLDDDGLKDHLAAAGIGLLPSSTPTEAFGLAMVEYMAAGLPVISTELGTGTSHVNQAELTGLIVPANDPAALAAGIVRLLSHPALRERMGAAGRVRVSENFTTQAMMRGMDRLYAEALERAGSRARHVFSGPPGNPRNGGQGLP
jgi:glycosyltransferase involved in cell wall biosynthesis